MTINIRTRFFLAVEGEGEQSFIKWLQELANKNGLHIHLDCHPLGGGGYRTMLEKALHSRQRNAKNRSKTKSSILLVDSDRADRDDGWSLSHLKKEALNEKIIVCVQNPNQEGWLLRMLPGKESLQPTADNVKKLLLRHWADYQKPIDARMLSSRFSLHDLLRVARVDLELKNLLSIIGLNRDAEK